MSTYWRSRDLLLHYNNKCVVKVKNVKQTAVSGVKVWCFSDPFIHPNLLTTQTLLFCYNTMWFQIWTIVSTKILQHKYQALWSMFFDFIYSCRVQVLLSMHVLFQWCPASHSYRFCTSTPGSCPEPLQLISHQLTEQLLLTCLAQGHVCQ